MGFDDLAAILTVPRARFVDRRAIAGCWQCAARNWLTTPPARPRFRLEYADPPRPRPPVRDPRHGGVRPRRRRHAHGCKTLPEQIARLSSMDGISALIAELRRSREALTILALDPDQHRRRAARPPGSDFAHRARRVDGRQRAAATILRQRNSTRRSSETVQIVPMPAYRSDDRTGCRQVQVTGEGADGCAV